MRTVWLKQPQKEPSILLEKALTIVTRRRREVSSKNLMCERTCTTIEKFADLPVRTIDDSRSHFDILATPKQACRPIIANVASF
jgi:hypothetical protein